MNLFYSDPAGIQGNTITIEGQEAIHISTVLRYSVGDEIQLTDGEGTEYRCEIVDVEKKRVYLQVLESQKHSKEVPGIILCMGIIKKRDRLEFAVEKAVEVGVQKIVLFEGEHSQKGKVREDRLESTAISAMKQSLRYFLPEIVVENSLSDAINKHATGAKIVVADETSAEIFNDPEKKIDTYFLIVGPEGGFSYKERENLKDVHSKPYSLGNYRYRTETAAIVMVDRFSNLK